MYWQFGLRSPLFIVTPTQKKWKWCWKKKNL